MKRRYIVRKYIMAESVADVLRVERKHRPDEVWIDEKWVEAHPEAESKKHIGFK